MERKKADVMIEQQGLVSAKVSLCTPRRHRETRLGENNRNCAFKPRCEFPPQGPILRNVCIEPLTSYYLLSLSLVISLEVPTHAAIRTMRLDKQIVGHRLHCRGWLSTKSEI